MKQIPVLTSRWCSPLLLVLVTVLIYLPGLYGGFEFDDGVNILENSALKLDKLSLDSILSVAMSGKSGPLGRPISMLSFAANYYLTDFEPLFFKLTNVFIHILAGLGVYVFVRQLVLALDRGKVGQPDPSHASTVALTTTGIWLVHPLNLTSVLYVVQRMTSLTALFTFFALAAYVFGRRQTIEGDSSRGLLLILIGVGPVTGIAALSKENGALAPYLMLCIELIVFRFVSTHKSTRVFLCVLFSAVVLIPIVMLGLNFERFADYVASGYVQREFSMAERLLTQPQVLMFYLRLLLMPSASALGIFHDDFPVSTSLTQNSGTLVSVVAILSLILIGLFAIRRAPALAVGILWFFAGHVMESTVLGLEMVHEHRNYLPIVGPIFAAAYYFWHPNFRTIEKKAKYGIVILAIAVFSSVTYVRSVEWSNLVDHAAIEVHNHPQSNRANYQMGRMYFMLYSNEPNIKMATLADQYFERAMKLGGNSVYPVAARILLAYKIRAEPTPGLVEIAVNRLQHGPPWEANMGALNNLVNCQMTEYCRLAETDMTALLMAVIANPDASPKMKGTAHSLLGGYYAVKLDKLELAIPHIKAAVKSEPDRIEYRLDLVRLHGVTDNFIAARLELDAARKLDKWGLQKARLDAESALLDSASRARTN